MTKREELISLYQNSSKHSNYQILASSLRKLIGEEDIKVQTRHELERLDYILKNISVNNKSLLDIGGNSGFFSFELIEKGAKSVVFYEGNKEHAEFVSLAAEVMDIEDKIKVVNDYYSFQHEDGNDKYDIALLLNVLHHVGDDYGDSGISLVKAKDEIAAQLNSMASKTSVLVFQLGFNWKGNRNTGLFKNGTKSELIDYIKENTATDWEIMNIGIAEKTGQSIRYNDLNEQNIKREDTLGEFLNRPLFIMKSRK